MNYLVIGADGREYGPVDVATLAEWAKADRVRPDSSLKEFDTGRMLRGSQVPGLFQPLAPPAPGTQQNWSQAPNYYQTPQGAQYGSGGGSALAWSFADAVLAVVMFFFLGGLGLIFGVFGVVNAFRAKSAGHPAAVVAIVVSILALGAVVVGWIMRLSGGGQAF